MAHEIGITISTPSQVVNITTDTSSYAITPTAVTQDFFEPQPDNTYSFTHLAPEIYSVTNTTGTSNISGFDCVGAVNVTLGALPYSQMAKELEGFKYIFPDFIQGGTSIFSAGDVVCFQEDVSEFANTYNSKLSHAKPHIFDRGAQNNLFLFLRFEGDDLYLLHKGYFDFEQDATNFDDWVAGRVIYLNEFHNLSTSPATASNSWVKSLGFCIPNTSSKKRIWFESDSTYLKIR